VAVGAAIQAGVLSGEVKDILLLDVTPLSLGVETLGGVMTRLIERNTTIPCKRSEVFSTASDSQTSVEIHVLQGEREMARDNRTLGRFHLEGIPPAPRGMPQIEVTFDIDANGILNAQARDKGTGREQKITITHSSGLAKDEVEKMVSDARAHEAEDKQKREEIEQRNRAENLAYQMEKLLKENKEKISAGVAKEIEEAVAELHKIREKGTAAEVKAAMERLERASHKAAEELYKTAAPGPGGPGPAPGEEKKKEGDVVDAEFKQV
jgi:molecular chaperone DnaK